MSDASRPPRNRLAKESSPYLRQHAHNPVDWYPWGDEAFEKARREDKPVFLSIGYSACHWCHVMERESFENEEIAALLNEHLVAVKVDREERPDVDEVYMSAAQTMVGRGGWPISALLSPDGRPLFGGTYFPPEDRHGRAGLPDASSRSSPRRGASGATSWRRGPTDLRRGREANRITERAGREPRAAATGNVLTATLKRTFDARHGGFGGAPKFPPHLALERLLLQASGGDASPGRWPFRRSTRWRSAGSTITSRAASTATRPTSAGSCRTSRRCCTTTRSSSRSMRGRSS